MDHLLAGGRVMSILDVGDAVVQELDFPTDYEPDEDHFRKVG